MRLLIAGQDEFLAEAHDVLRAGLQTATWVSVDDTGARHQGVNSVCTQIGNDDFAWFGTTRSKSRLTFLDLLRAGHTDYVINETALAYMREHSLAGPTIARLAEHLAKQFADPAAWQAHLERLGITALSVTPDPVQIATEGALWGSIHSHEFLRDMVIVSDDAGQFDVGHHALCWVHAERLIHKLDTFTEQQRASQQRVRSLIWGFYAELKAYRTNPTPRRRGQLRARFDRIFGRRTGFVTLDRLLARLRANKAELLAVLDRPDIPLHTNGSERDIRCHVMIESLCSLSLSIWKHWKSVLLGDATRASGPGDRCCDGRRGEVVGPDLIRRATYDLHRRQNAGRNQLSYHVPADTQLLRCLAQSEPCAAFFC
jgi:hypothetical protein